MNSKFLALYFNYKVLMKLLNHYIFVSFSRDIFVLLSTFFVFSLSVQDSRCRSCFPFVVPDSPHLFFLSHPVRKIFFTSAPEDFFHLRSAFFFPTFSSSIATPTSCSFNPHVPHLSLDLNRCISSISYYSGQWRKRSREEKRNWQPVRVNSVHSRK